MSREIKPLSMPPLQKYCIYVGNKTVNSIKSVHKNSEIQTNSQSQEELSLHCGWWNHAAAQPDSRQNSETRTLLPSHLQCNSQPSVILANIRQI